MFAVPICVYLLVLKRLEVIILHPSPQKRLFDLFISFICKVRIIQFGENILSLSIGLPVVFKSLSRIFL